MQTALVFSPSYASRNLNYPVFANLDERGEEQRTQNATRSSISFSSIDIVSAGNNSTVGQPGTWESFIPIWGSGRAAIDHFQNGNYWRGTGYTALAITDVALVKIIVTALGKGIAKLGVMATAELIEDAAAKTVPKALNPGINMTKKGLAHTLERHTVNDIAKWAGKSKFSNASEVPGLIRQATQQPMLEQAYGNFARVVNAGRTIGIDRATGQSTSIYTVITGPNGNLITAFPGMP